jgi:hypothetical protein
MLWALARWLISSIHIFMNRAPVLAGRGGIDRLFDRRGLMVTRRMVTSQVNSEKALFSGSQGSGSRSGSQQKGGIQRAGIQSGIH